MKTKFYNHQGEHLILYFAGWGMPPDAVNHLILPENHDLLICYDYQDLNLDFDFSAYRHIRLVAWSMGVWAAERALQGIRLKSATAVNGTGLPCDDNFGIPCAVFKGTLENLTMKILVQSLNVESVAIKHLLKITNNFPPVRLTKFIKNLPHFLR